MRTKIIGILNIALGLVIAIGTRTFLHVCGAGMDMDGMEMSGPPCAGIPTASLIVGALLAVTGIILFVSGSKKAVSIVFGIVSIIAGIATIGIPTFIVGVCESAHMHCHMVTRPALIIIGALVIVFGIIDLGIELSGGSSKESA